MRKSLFPYLAIFALISPLHAELKVERPLVDLGEVRGGQRVSATFEFTNAGTEMIELLDLERSCGCVEPKWRGRKLAPGQAGSVQLELRTLGQTEGKRQWPAQIVYREGTTVRKTTIAVAGDLKQDILLQPAHLAMSVKQELSQEIVVQDRRATPLKVLDAKTNIEGVSLEFRAEDGGKTRVFVRAKASDLKADRQMGTATLLTNDAIYERLEIPLTISRSKESAVAVDPEEAVLRLGTASNAIATLRLRSRTEQPVEIADLQTSDPSIKATWTRTPTGGAVLRIQASRPMAGRVRIRFRGMGDELVIPVDVRE